MHIHLLVLIFCLAARPATGAAPGVLAERVDALERQVRSLGPGRPTTAEHPSIAVGGVTRLTLGDFREGTLTRAAVGEPADGVTFRTTRLWARGQLAEDVGFQTEMDFAQPGRPSFQNAFLELQRVPGAGTLRLGRWKQPFSLETMTSIRFLTFVERASLFALVPFRKTGAGAFDTYDGQSGSWAISVHRASDDQFGNDVGPAGGTAVTARVTRLLEFEDQGATVTHIGAAVHHADPANGVVRFASAPELALGAATATNTPAFADTGAIAAEDYSLLGLEAALVRGPFSLQAEFARAEVDRLAGPPLSFPSAYVFASWFLTGEHRNYSRTAGAFDRQAVKRPFQGRSGGGAWELAVRRSMLDLEDGNVLGNRMDNWTFGLNWHINSRSKILFNHIVTELDVSGRGPDRSHSTGVQAVFDF